MTNFQKLSQKLVILEVKVNNTKDPNHKIINNIINNNKQNNIINNLKYNFRLK